MIIAFHTFLVAVRRCAVACQQQQNSLHGFRKAANRYHTKKAMKGPNEQMRYTTT